MEQQAEAVEVSKPDLPQGLAKLMFSSHLQFSPFVHRPPKWDAPSEIGPCASIEVRVRRAVCTANRPCAGVPRVGSVVVRTASTNAGQLDLVRITLGTGQRLGRRPVAVDHEAVDAAAGRTTWAPAARHGQILDGPLLAEHAGSSIERGSSPA